MENNTRGAGTPEQSVHLEALSGRELMTYDPEFDTQMYGSFHKLSFTDQLVREQEKQRLDAYTEANLQTMLGERYHVLMSKQTYEIRDGQLYSPLWKEPLLKLFQRGVEHRKKNGSTPDDQEREQAEVESFATTQTKLCTPNTPDKVIAIEVSLPGKNRMGKKRSEYQHNFYDIYMKKGKTVEYRRYSSALTPEETFAKVVSLDPWYAISERKDPAFLPDDIYFKRNPIYLDPMANSHITPEAIHTFFHRDYDFMGEEEFSYILSACKGYMDAYIHIVSENPNDRHMRNLAYNALLNRADEVAQTFRKAKEKGGLLLAYDRTWATMPTKEQLYTLGTQQVRETTTGCGTSGGMSLTDLVERNPVQDLVRSRWSVLDVGILEYSSDLGYTFEEPEEGENCIMCGAHVSLGPCGICEACDRRERFKVGQPLPIQIAA